MCEALVSNSDFDLYSRRRLFLLWDRLLTQNAAILVHAHTPWSRRRTARTGRPSARSLSGVHGVCQRGTEGGGGAGQRGKGRQKQHSKMEWTYEVLTSRLYCDFVPVKPIRH